MLRACLRPFVVVAAFLAGCGDGGTVTDPLDGGGIAPGLTVTGLVQEIIHDCDTCTDIKQLTVQITITNQSDVARTVYYEAGCPVRIRLYPLNGTVAVYDEARLPCPVTTLVPLTVLAGGTQTMTSGSRQPWVVHGDSIPMGPYRAVGLVRLLGDAPVAVEAGTYLLPFCTDEGVVFMMCTYPPS